MGKYFLIGLGGFLGSSARYLVSGWAADRWGATFPFGTLIVNVTGSLLLGLVLTLTTERVLLNPQWRLFLVIGFLAAYTTFSTYAVESANLLTNGGIWPGLVNVLTNNLIGFVAVLLGSTMARWLI